MQLRLPGQKVTISPRLQRLFSQAQKECDRPIKFEGISPEEKGQFEGRTEWRDTNIIIEVRDTLNIQIAEYIAAHELCHALQLARGYPIASGRVDEPGAVAIAKHITDLVFDSAADTMAVGFGFSMSSSFEQWLQSTGLLEVLKKPRNGRRYGVKWKKIWEKLEETRVNRQLGLKVPTPPREYWTLWVAFDLANAINRATNFGLEVGSEIRENIQRLPLLAKVVDDLLLNVSSPIRDVEDSMVKLVNIFNYIDTVPGHFLILWPFHTVLLPLPSSAIDRMTNNMVSSFTWYVNYVYATIVS